MDTRRGVIFRNRTKGGDNDDEAVLMIWIQEEG